MSKQQYYLLLLLCTLGGTLLIASQHFVSLLLSIELMGISLYIMVAYYAPLGYSHSERFTEAAAKYLLLSAFASAFMLFGAALIYAATGSMRLFDLSTAFSMNPSIDAWDDWKSLV